MGAVPESDAELVAAARTGDARASGALYERHHGAVLGYARGLVRDRHTAEDLTSEAFTRTFAALREGLGPREACRPYLYAAVRNAAVDWARAGRRTVVTDEVARWADGPVDEQPDVDELDALVRAFRSLPERWQTVLWHTVIEDEPVARVGELLGMRPGAVAQLSFRAREGLRQAFLAASVAGRPECAEFTRQLAASTRRPGRRRGRALRRHLETCADCRRAAAEMADLNGRLRAVLPVGIFVVAAAGAVRGKAAALSLSAWALPAGMVGAALVIGAVVVVTVDPGPAGSGPVVAGPTRGAAPGAVGRPTAVPPVEDAPTMATVVQPRRTRPAASASASTAAGGTTARIRNTTLQSCLVPDGGSVAQRSCGGATAKWRRTTASGGFTLASAATGQCLARGEQAAGVPWEGGAEYTVALAPCGGPNQVWKIVAFAPGVDRLVNGDGWYLQASWSGLAAPALKPFSFAGMAAQGWAVEGA
ncbi:sigma-70 family RNA polymerase sigma factor [Actinomadura parmotrematis]|uniref:Sigma-70 family RNA polymerase sigma factor n=1 Tax=Actinomadura parmotrematis TaxID=2864039 RepID=A0ABS7FW98_9ACTN|nr:sigma-70 family RNA polymerase sigma factor [Actinomadura parmotrematis]MBW8483954.1 sigma-70 family RNA polymerase sigma factor [Actinomadura parmotrematis]